MLTPHTLNVYVTGRCNNTCVFCTGKDAHKPTRDMSPAMLSMALDTFPSIKSACIAGLGEPLLGHGISEVIITALNRLSNVSLITNGQSILHRRNVPFSRLSYVSVSLNESDPELYQKRCGSSLRVALDGILYLKQAGANVGVSYVLGRSNLDRAWDYLTHAADLGASFVSLVNTLDDGLEALRPDHLGCLPDLQRHAADLGVTVNHWPKPLMEQPQDTKPSCRSPYDTLGVDGDGSVSGCQRILGPRPELGSLLSSGADCGDSAHFQFLRRNLENAGPSQDLRHPCRSCFGAYS